MRERKLINNKTFTIIGALVIILLAGGVSIAFFNYTRTGGANSIQVGRISFTSSQETITFENVFPIDSTQAATDTTNAKTMSVTVTGDTDYTNGLEYVITVSDVNLSVNNKQLPLALEVSVANNSNLGTAETGDYYTNRDNYTTSKYKVEYNEDLKNGSHILVGYIAPNATAGTPSGIEGTINIKAYIDKDRILISDTYPEGNVTINNQTYYNGTTNPSDKIVFTTSEWNAITGVNALSFKIKVEANEGIWVEEPLTALGTIIKNVDTTTLINFGNASSSSNGEGVYILPGTENDTNPIYYYRGAINNNNVIFGDYCWQMVRTTDTGGIKMIYNGAVTGNGETCENTAHADRIISSSKFNDFATSMSDVGYMSNKRYAYQSVAATSGAYFGSGVSYANGVYTLTGTSTTKDASHHYTCNNTNASASCSPVRYYFYNNNYIDLEGGEDIEDAIYKMTGNGTAAVKARTVNQNYVLNYNDSTAKTVIESWFRTNLTNEVDNTKTNYRAYIEDTVYCNDRSFRQTGDYTLAKSGWNPNADGTNGNGDLTTHIYFNTTTRWFNNNWYSTSNVPTTACPNETDRFTESSITAHLNYPIGLLTGDEIIMAGAAGNSSPTNNTYYLYTGYSYWSMSPHRFYQGYAGEFNVNSDGYLINFSVGISNGLRPVISLKPGIEFESGGAGTPTNPYVVKYD